MTQATAMDRVLFGDNQFFGVNHMSEEKARAQSMRFQDLQAVIDVLDAAYQEGIRTFMCTTHDRVAEICEYFRVNSDKYPDYQFYPCMPYAHKYANAVTENGMIEALRMFLPQDGAVGANHCVNPRSRNCASAARIALRVISARSSPLRRS